MPPWAMPPWHAARVLWAWDFRAAPVCNRVAAFLDAIMDKPLICVSAENPVLYKKVWQS